MKYIDADHLEAEIERRYKEFDGKTGDIATASRLAYFDVLSYLNTLQEQPASDDLEEEVDKYFQGWTNDDEYGDALMPDYKGVNVDKCKEIARHFAEWGAEHLKK